MEQINERERELLAQCLKKAEESAKKLAETAGVIFYARIESVGAPTLCVSMARQKFWWTKNKTEKHLKKVYADWMKICEDNGVIPMAKISDLGARIEYALTDKMRKTLEPKPAEKGETKDEQKK